MREIQKPENAAAFVVLPSQFNGVEFPSHCSIVESVEDYKYDHTGGPCGQLATHPGLAQFLLDNACTHRRPNGIDATRQLLRKVNGALEEKGIFSKKLQFSVLNGYLKMPVPDSEEARNGHDFQSAAADMTEFTNATHPVNLVYASAVPVNAYVNGIGAVAKGFGDDQMQAFQRNVAELFLIAQYLGALQVASNTAKVLKVRSGGAFKNSWESIVKSIAMAVELCQSDLDLLDIHVLVLDGGKAGKSDDTPAEQRRGGSNDLGLRLEGHLRLNDSPGNSIKEELMDKPAMEGLEDLEPTPATPELRTWTWTVFAGAWATMMVNAATFSSGAALLSLGLSVYETLLAQTIGALLLVIGLCLNAAAGVKYGIPFPVFARSSFGSAGAHFCTLSRGGVAIMWLSFQAWQGALGIYTSLERVFGSRWLEDWGHLGNNLNVSKLTILILYLALHAVLIHFGPAKLKRWINLVLPVVMLGMLGIAIWAASLASFPEAMEAAEEHRPLEIGSKTDAFMTAVNSSLSSWSTLLLNVCDLSRFSPTQKDQVLGQSMGIPIPFVLTLFSGMWLAGATHVAYGKAVWMIPECFAYWNPVVSVFSGLLLALSTLMVNVLANIISPINDFMNLAPQHFSYRGCGYVVLILSLLVCPWWTFSGKVSFVLNFLTGYAMITGTLFRYRCQLEGPSGGFLWSSTLRSWFH
eukprot:symbB.v1.2.021722.t2/scaffold1894.1/size98026/1